MTGIGGSLLLAAAFLLPPSRVRAQGAWAPPAFRFVRQGPPIGARPLHPIVLEVALPRMAAKDFRGLGREAREVAAWLEGKDKVFLARQGGTARLTDPSGGSIELSPGLGAALERADQYFGLTPATLASPPTPEELRAAALSPAGVERVARLFERAIAERFRAPSGVVVPELGGEATLGADGLDLHEFPDLTRPAMRAVAENAQDPEALRRLFAEMPAAMEALDEQGLLRRALDGLPRWEANGVPRERREKVLAMTVDTVLLNGADSYVFDPETQFESIAGQEWSGRYVGRWHTHPPGAGKGGWTGAEGPSGPDMDIAVKDGQSLVLAFHPEGFDFYDLSPLADSAPDLRKALKASHRSPEWRERFQALFDRTFP